MLGRTFFCEGAEALAQLTQRSCGSPTHGSVKSRVERGSKQPGVVEGVLAHGRVVGTR